MKMQLFTFADSKDTDRMRFPQDISVSLKILKSQFIQQPHGS